jgi:hypothetical protein
VVEAQGARRSGAGSQWFAVTSRRLLFGSKVTKADSNGIRHIHESCSLPLPSVSKVKLGAPGPNNDSQAAQARLTVKGQGTEVALAFPTLDEAIQVQGLLAIILQRQGA